MAKSPSHAHSSSDEQDETMAQDDTHMQDPLGEEDVSMAYDTGNEENISEAANVPTPPGQGKGLKRKFFEKVPETTQVKSSEGRKKQKTPPKSIFDSESEMDPLALPPSTSAGFNEVANEPPKGKSRGRSKKDPKGKMASIPPPMDGSEQEEEQLPMVKAQVPKGKKAPVPPPTDESEQDAEPPKVKARVPKRKKAPVATAAMTDESEKDDKQPPKVKAVPKGKKMPVPPSTDESEQGEEPPKVKARVLKGKKAPVATAAMTDESEKDDKQPPMVKAQVPKGKKPKATATTSTATEVGRVTTRSARNNPMPSTSKNEPTKATKPNKKVMKIKVPTPATGKKLTAFQMITVTFDEIPNKRQGLSLFEVKHFISSKFDYHNENAIKKAIKVGLNAGNFIKTSGVGLTGKFKPAPKPKEKKRESVSVPAPRKSIGALNKVKTNKKNNSVAIKADKVPKGTKVVAGAAKETKASGKSKGKTKGKPAKGKPAAASKKASGKAKTTGKVKEDRS